MESGTLNLNKTNVLINTVRKVNKMYTYLEGRNKTVFVHR